MGGNVLNISASSSTGLPHKDDEAPPESMNLLNPDIWLGILYFLPIPDLFSMQVVCRFFYNLMGDQFWRGIYRRDFSQDTRAISHIQFLPQKQVARLYRQYVFPLYNSPSIKFTEDLRDEKKSPRSCINLLGNFFSSADPMLDVASSSQAQEIICEENAEKIFCELAKETLPVDKLLEFIIKKLPSQRSILLWGEDGEKNRTSCTLALIHRNFPMVERFLTAHENTQKRSSELLNFFVGLLDNFCDYVENDYVPENDSEQALIHFFKIEGYMLSIMRNIKMSFGEEVKAEDRVIYKSHYLKRIKAFFYFSKKLFPLFHEEIAEEIFKSYGFISFDYLQKLCILGDKYNKNYLKMYEKCFDDVFIEDSILKGDRILLSACIEDAVTAGNEFLFTELTEKLEKRFPKKAFFKLLNTLPTYSDENNIEARIRMALDLLEKVPQKKLHDIEWTHSSIKYGVLGLGLLSNQYEIVLEVMNRIQKKESCYKMRKGDRKVFVQALVSEHSPSLKALLDSGFTAKDYGIAQNYYDILSNNSDGTDNIISEKVLFQRSILWDIFLASLKEKDVESIVKRVFTYVKVDAETFAQMFLELGNLYCKFQNYGHNKDGKYIIVCQDLKSEFIINFIKILKKYFLHVENPQNVMTYLQASKYWNNLLALSSHIQDFFCHAIKECESENSNESPIGSFKVPREHQSRSPAQQFIRKFSDPPPPNAPRLAVKQGSRDCSPFTLGPPRR